MHTQEQSLLGSCLPYFCLSHPVLAPRQPLIYILYRQAYPKHLTYMESHNI